jgi:hypothetical protein
MWLGKLGTSEAAESSRLPPPSSTPTNVREKVLLRLRAALVSYWNNHEGIGANRWSFLRKSIDHSHNIDNNPNFKIGFGKVFF